MNKSFRQGQILRVVREKSVLTQEELARELKALGIDATQVTLSRDIRELGLAKTPQGYRQIALERLGRDPSGIIAETLRDVRAAQNLVVLKTPPGNANPLAVALDASGWPEIVGTLAGDDTVLVVAPDNDTAAALSGKLRQFLK